jgi:hypothetical protein
MSKKKKELERALHALIGSISNIKVGDWKASFAESSSAALTLSSKGKAKVANPDWEDKPFHHIPITPLSSRPRFVQVVGSSSELLAPPLSVFGAAAAAAAAAMQPPGGGRGRGVR